MSDPNANALDKPADPAADSRALRRARSRAAILAAARDILNAEDADAFTARGVAERAGVSAGLVMQHFASMADLALEVFVEANAEFVGAIEQARDQDAPLVDRVFGVFRTLLERDLARPAMTRKIMAYAWTWGPKQEAHFQTSVQHVFDVMLELFQADAGHADVDARRAAAAALVTVYNSYLRTAVSANQDPVTALARMRPPMEMVLRALVADAR